jgi:molecular chaperone DnaK
VSRNTFDYGIDLGTTNSAISVVVGTGTEIIKNNVDSDITPSAVYINRVGALWVGQNARSKMADERAEDDVFLEFKRRMGTGFEYKFRASGRRMRPEELSAEVLKSLRGDVAHKRGEEISSAVITVPAAFELHQCDATKRAAELAGFKNCALLQEPVAAALAYGYQKIQAKAYWLVFDFGGGTFDAALIRSEDGSMVVANHGGDNFLGGSDIDWAIVEQVLAPRVIKEFGAGAADFARGTERFKYDFLRLKAAAETAKIDLSRKDTTYLEAVLRNVRGETVTFETELTRADLARAAEPIVAKAVAIAKRVLDEKSIDPSAVEKLIFVGGPTLAPYFRELVKAQLGVAFDFSVDPLTVVARGAAIFAGTQRMPAPTGKTPSPFPRATIDLIYKPVGPDAEPLVGGKVMGPAGASVAGFTLEVVNQQSKWRSGKVTLKDNGSFQFTIRAERNVQNVFSLELCDTTGSSCDTKPSSFNYTVGMVVEEQPIIHNMGVATADNKIGLHFTKGQGLPAKSKRSYRTSRALKPGQEDAVVRIPIVEGDRELADRNVLIGTLEIGSGKIKREVPAGSEIEVTLQMDASRLLTVLAYLPLLDEEFPIRIELGGKIRQPDVVILRQEYAREKSRVKELELSVRATGDRTTEDGLKAIIASGSFKELEARLQQPSIDFDALLKVERELLELKIKLDGVGERIAWPVSVKAIDSELLNLERLAADQGTAEEKNRVRALREQVRGIILEKNPDRLKKKREEVADVYSSILYRQTSYWLEHFEALAQTVDQMRDPAKGQELARQGQAHLDKGNLGDLKQVVFQLQDLLPAVASEEPPRGYGSGLLT